MDKSYHNKTPIVVRSLEIEKDPFTPWDIEEKILGPRFHILVSLEHYVSCKLHQA